MLHTSTAADAVELRDSTTDVPALDTTRAPPADMERIRTSSTSEIDGITFVNVSNVAEERHT